jgi:hypothetical protein
VRRSLQAEHSATQTYSQVGTRRGGVVMGKSERGADVDLIALCAASGVFRWRNSDLRDESCLWGGFSANGMTHMCKEMA